MDGGSAPIPRSARAALGARLTEGPPGRVLIVDDDDSIRQLLADLLTESGYEADQARNGREALERIAQRRPDVILLDQLMPDGDGTMFAAAYASVAPPRAPIIALCAARDGAQWSAAIGAAALVAKPFDIDELLAAVRAHAPAGSDGAA